MFVPLDASVPFNITVHPTNELLQSTCAPFER
jgi:hypothetical protein